MAQFIEIRNAKTDEMMGIRTALKDAKFAGAHLCGTDGFYLVIMQIDVNQKNIVKLLGGYGGFASSAEQREYTVSEEGLVKEVK